MESNYWNVQRFYLLIDWCWWKWRLMLIGRKEWRVLGGLECVRQHLCQSVCPYGLRLGSLLSSSWEWVWVLQIQPGCHPGISFGTYIHSNPLLASCQFCAMPRIPRTPRRERQHLDVRSCLDWFTDSGVPVVVKSFQMVKRKDEMLQQKKLLISWYSGCISSNANISSTSLIVRRIFRTEVITAFRVSCN